LKGKILPLMNADDADGKQNLTTMGMEKLVIARLSKTQNQAILSLKSFSGPDSLHSSRREHVQEELLQVGIWGYGADPARGH
jgi:hypothetical protein